MELKTVLLTPEMASGFLESVDEKQRKLSVGYAATIARDITEGRWNEEYALIDVPITITESGKLSNGQHRCKGVVLANRPIITRICYGVPDDMFEYMDNAKNRTSQQFVNTRYANTVVPVARFAISIEEGTSLRLSIVRPAVGKADQNSSVQASRAEIIDFVKKNTKELELCAEQGQRIYRAFNRAGGGKAVISCAIWLLLYLREADINEIISFVDEISDTQPQSAAIAQGKQVALKKIIFAQKEKVKIDKRFWFALVLEMFDKRTRGSIKGASFVDKTIEKYAQKVDFKRTQTVIEIN